jgi:fatty-acyl-CoA synthase
MKASDQLTLREMLHRAARWYPANEAAVDEQARYTYAELLDSAKRCADLYHRLGVRKGSLVALLLYSSSAHCVALFGATELGAIPVALHPRESDQVLIGVINRLCPTVVVYDAAMEKKVAGLLPGCPTVVATVRARSAAPGDLHPDATPSAEIPGDLHRYAPDLEPMPVYEDDPAVIVMSSGTTALPKGIVHTNRTLMESARGGVYMWNGIGSEDTILNISTTSFVGWYNISLPFFNVGAKNVFRHKWDPRGCLEAMQDEKITAAFLTPTMWRMLFKEDVSGYDLRAVRKAAFAGEVMDSSTLRKIREHVTPQVTNVYGATETGSCSAGTVLRAEEMTEERLASVGKPTLNADIRIVQPGGTIEDRLPKGGSGEVLIAGPSVASQVWDDPATARKIFESDGANTWWHSGDMGRVDEDGYLYLEGRVDDMIISSGINILPARVEDVLLSHPDVVECAVIGVAHPDGGQQVKAYVVPRRPDLEPDQLDEFMRDSELSGYQRPRLYELVDDLPRTSSLKVNRRALRELESGRALARAGD